MLAFWQQNYAHIVHDPQDGIPLQVYIVQEPINCEATGFRSIDSQSFIHQALPEKDVPL
jgi:hypothetical protein